MLQCRESLDKGTDKRRSITGQVCIYITASQTGRYHSLQTAQVQGAVSTLQYISLVFILTWQDFTGETQRGKLEQKNSECTICKITYNWHETPTAECSMSILKSHLKGIITYCTFTGSHGQHPVRDQCWLGTYRTVEPVVEVGISKNVWQKTSILDWESSMLYCQHL